MAAKAAVARTLRFVKPTAGDRSLFHRREKETAFVGQIAAQVSQ